MLKEGAATEKSRPLYQRVLLGYMQENKVSLEEASELLTQQILANKEDAGFNDHLAELDEAIEALKAEGFK
jgi:hypothetical protein